jgi:hypothetical protein
LENLSSALQAVQELIKKSSANLTTNSPTSSATAQITATLANELSTLSNKILSTNTHGDGFTLTTSQNQLVRVKSKPITPLKRQQLEAPSYTPTPLVELKRIKQEQRDEPDVEVIEIANSDEDDDMPESKKRKNNPEPVNDKVNQEMEFVVVDDDSNELKSTTSKIEPKSPSISLHTNNSASSSAASITSSTSSKFDVVSFSKMSVKQQVIKRYELLKKTPPTAEELRDARLKRQQSDLTGLVKSNYTPNTAASNKSPAPAAFIPKLLLDSNDSSSKCPVPMRQRYLQMIFDNLKPLYLSTANEMAKALLRASQEEKAAYDRAKSKAIYTNVIANVVRKIRSEVVESGGSVAVSTSTATSSSGGTTRLVNNPNKVVNMKRPAQPVMTISHEAMLGGAKASKVSYSINRVKAVEVKDLKRKFVPIIFNILWCDRCF